MALTRNARSGPADLTADAFAPASGVVPSEPCRHDLPHAYLMQLFRAGVACRRLKSVSHGGCTPGERR